MIIGNGATDFNVDVSPSYPDTVYNFNLIKKDLYETYINNSCFFSFNGVIPESHSDVCVNAWTKINALCADLNWYDLYRKKYPNALRADDEERWGEVEINGEIKRYRRGKTVEEYTPWIPHVKGDQLFGVSLTDYINLPLTRKAMNIPDALPAFELCRHDSSWLYQSQAEGSLWIYGILQNKLRILFYSGDTDGAVNTYGSRRWIKSLNWTIKN